MTNTDLLDLMLPFDEAIMEATNMTEKPQGINHQWSYFLPSENSLRFIEVDLATNKNFHWYKIPLAMHDAYAKGNMANISQTMPINISNNPGVVENVFIRVECTPEKIETYTTLFKEYHEVFTWSYEEILGIDPWIVKHEIKVYPNAKLVRRKLRDVNHKKSLTIKAEIKKLLRDGFIYLVPLIKWVSNPVLVNKK